MLNTKQNIHIITDVTLPKYKTWTIEGHRHGDVISCTLGTLWITQDGDMKDYIVEAGRSFWVTRPGMVIVQALNDSKFKYSLNEMQDHIEVNQQPMHSSVKPRINSAR
jgi:hypothetical protein